MFFLKRAQRYDFVFRIAPAGETDEKADHNVESCLIRAARISALA